MVFIIDRWRIELKSIIILFVIIDLFEKLLDHEQKDRK